MPRKVQPRRVEARKLVEEYRKRAGIKRPIVFEAKARKSGFVEVRTKYAKKTGRTVETKLKYNPAHMEAVRARAPPEQADVYLRYAIAHEIGHLQHQKELGPKIVARIPRALAEKEADVRAFKLTGYSEKKVANTLKALQKLF